MHFCVGVFKCFKSNHPRDYTLFVSVFVKNTDELFPLQCVVIGLQSTGEARTLEALEEGGGELNDFVSTAKYVQAADDFSHTFVILFVIVCHCNTLCCAAGVCCSP